MKKRKFKIFSFFSGSGFLDLGFEMLDSLSSYQGALLEI